MTVILSYGIGVESTAILARWIFEPATRPCPAIGRSREDEGYMAFSMDAKLTYDVRNGFAAFLSSITEVLCLGIGTQRNQKQILISGHTIVGYRTPPKNA